jgi:hypothetical protein
MSEFRTVSEFGPPTLSEYLEVEGIFIFGGGGGRLGGVTDLCCQCQVSQRRS